MRPSRTAATIEAKLSSSEHHLRRLLGGFGALAAHCDADVGALQRRRIVDAITGHRHHCVAGLQGFDNAELVLGAGAGEDRGMLGHLPEGGPIEPVQPVASGDPVVIEQAELPADRGRSGGMVAGDHLYPDSGRPALGHGRDGIVPRRIDHAENAEEDDAVFEIVKGKRVGSGGHWLHAESENALAVRCQPVNLAMPTIPIDRLDAIVTELFAAKVKNPLRRALDIDDRRPLGLAMQRRHESMAGIEGNLVDARIGAPCCLLVIARLDRERNQRAFHWIAFYDPAAVGRTKARIVAKERRPADRPDQFLGDPVRLTVLSVKRARRLVADPGDLDHPIGGADRADRHLVAGERAGLVGADHRHRSQRLHRRQSPDDGVAPRHPLDADGERDRHHRRQAFGDRGDDEADHRHEGVGQRIGADEHREGEADHRDRENRRGELPGEAVHLPDQRRGHGFDRAEEAADVAELGGLAGGDHHTGGLPRHDQGARIGHRRAVAEHRLRRHRMHTLVDRHRLAGQRRLLDPEAPRLDQPDVGGDPIPGFEENHVAGDQRFDGNRQPAAVADDRGARGDHVADRIERPFRPPFLHEADHCIGDHHREDHRRVSDFAEQRGDHGRTEKHVDEDVGELAEEAYPCALRPRLRQPVGAVGRKPLGRFGGANSAGSGGKLAVDIVDRCRPGRRHAVAYRMLVGVS